MDNQVEQILEFARMIKCEVSTNEEKKTATIETKKSIISIVWEERH